MSWISEIGNQIPDLIDEIQPFITTPAEAREYELKQAQLNTQTQMAGYQTQAEQFKTQQTQTLVFGLGGIAGLLALVYIFKK